MRDYKDGIRKLVEAKGAKAKQAVLAEYKDCVEFRKFLRYALNPMLAYHVSEKTLREGASLAEEYVDTRFEDIFDYCEFLAGARGVSDAMVKEVQTFLYRDMSESARELFIGLLSKTLRLGVTAKTVNRVIVGCVPEWEVQQSYPIDKYPLAADTEFWLTQKLNGVRATYYNGKLIARSGTPYEGLDHILDVLDRPQTKGLVLDGELLLRDKGELSDNEAFRLSTGIINSDAKDKTVVCFTVFDCVPLEDFDSPSPTIPYSKRRERLNALDFSDTDYVRVLPLLYHGNDQSVIPGMLDQMVREDKEGLMVNTDVPYKRTRHRGILKVKRFYTMDLPILRCAEGEGRLAGTLGAFIVDYKGNEVNVGSGFDDAQRQNFWERREELVGTLCEVKYKEVSYDKKTGKESLQFPIFVGLRLDKTEPSYG